jgi:hypothetical protein
MEKKIAGLLGAMATLGAFNGAEAAPKSGPYRHFARKFFRRLARADPECRCVAQGCR